MRRIRPDSSRRRGRAGSSVVSPSRRASGSKLAPWTRVEVTTTKKTIEKSSCPAPTPATTGKVASQIGVAPRSPAQPSIAARAARRGKGGRGEGGERAGDQDQTAESASPSSATSSSVLGKTSSPSRMKRPIWATQPTPSWKATIVRRAGMLPEPSARRGQVDGEQAGAVRDLGQAVGERRRSRSSPPGRCRRSAAAPRFRAGDGEPAEREPDRRAERQFERQQARHVGEPVARAAGSSR